MLQEDPSQLGYHKTSRTMEISPLASWSLYTEIQSWQRCADYRDYLPNCIGWNQAAPQKGTQFVAWRLPWFSLITLPRSSTWQKSGSDPGSIYQHTVKIYHQMRAYKTFVDKWVQIIQLMNLDKSRGVFVEQAQPSFRSYKNQNHLKGL